MQIKNHTFIVTGGAGGLGKQVVHSLVQKGGFVSIFDTNQALAEELVKDVGTDKCYFPGPIDVTSECQVEKGIKDTVDHFPSPLVGAILSSGIVASSIKGYGPNNELTSYGQFEHIMRVNLLGTFCVAQKVSEVLLKNEPIGEDKERGIILTVSSILGLDGLLVGYGTSKAGIIGLTLPLAKELAPHGIRVMSIAPGPFETPLVNQSGSTPSCLFPKRYGHPEEFAEMVLQVIQIKMLNGSVIRLDGALRA